MRLPASTGPTSRLCTHGLDKPPLQSAILTVSQSFKQMPHGLVNVQQTSFDRATATKNGHTLEVPTILPDVRRCSR